jgi:H+-translocating NAD(P) transhydrogenase subunit beta
LTIGAAVSANGLTATYLASAVCFIVALKALSSPRRARYGNLIGVAGMVIAVGITLADRRGAHAWVIAGGMVLGAAIAVPAARLVRMTAMPQMVAAFNGVGGAAAALVSLVEFLRDQHGIGSLKALEISFGVMIGCLSFAGSAVAFAKLQELMTGRPLTFRFQQWLHAAAAVAMIGLVVAITVSPHVAPLVILAVLSLGLGAGVALPVGGADTPVLISLLNALTGLAVAADGFVLHNLILLIAGTLVGASGALLTKLMSDGMGRSLPNIIFRPLATAGSTAEVAGASAASVRSADATDIGTLLAYARRVMIVPGYGLAVAQAQHVVVELAQALEARGVEVAYAIHPVAGRMPGHMNVLLAEANVPYESLDEMETANAKFSGTDVALVVGANDVVNPAARDTPTSPLYGMPILDVDLASNVVFLKRSLRPGFSGVDNALLYDRRTVLLFGDAADSLRQLVVSVKHA